MKLRWLAYWFMLEARKPPPGGARHACSRTHALPLRGACMPACGLVSGSGSLCKFLWTECMHAISMAVLSRAGGEGQGGSEGAGGGSGARKGQSVSSVRACTTCCMRPSQAAPCRSPTQAGWMDGPAVQAARCTHAQRSMALRCHSAPATLRRRRTSPHRTAGPRGARTQDGSDARVERGGAAAAGQGAVQVPHGARTAMHACMHAPMRARQRARTQYGHRAVQRAVRDVVQRLVCTAWRGAPAGHRPDACTVPVLDALLGRKHPPGAICSWFLHVHVQLLIGSSLA